LDKKFSIFYSKNFDVLKRFEKSAAGAGDAAVVNYATFDEVHRDYLSARSIYLNINELGRNIG
jgi:hypothetical protein